MRSCCDAESRIYFCPNCNYTYQEYFDYKKQATNYNKPFIVLEGTLMYFKPRDYAPDKAIKLYHYACPECGILQIDTSDI